MNCHLGRDLDRLNHAFWIGSSLARLSKGRSVIDRNPDDGQATRDVDSRYSPPGLRFLVILEAQEFGGDMSLVMVHHDNKVILPPLHF